MKAGVRACENPQLPIRRVIWASGSLAVFAIVVEAIDEKAALSIATLDLRRFRTARLDCSCLWPKRQRLFPAHYLARGRMLIWRVWDLQASNSSTRTAAARASASASVSG